MGFWGNILNRLRGKVKRHGEAASNRNAEDSETLELFSWKAPFESMVMGYDDNHLFQRARTQWQFGDWESLARIKREDLYHHPQRVSLALLAAVGCQQRGDMNTTREFTLLAREWGASKKMISQVLIAGVHNTLGKASTLCGQQQRALEHFEESFCTTGEGGDVKLLTQVRAGWQAGVSKSFGGVPSLLASNPFEQKVQIDEGQQIQSDFPSGHQAQSDKYTVLGLIHDLVRPGLYLEIGVGQGKSLALAACPAVGVDPVPRQMDHLSDTVQLVTATSDEFFADMAGQVLSHTPDLILLDGMPLLEYVLRDLIHAESLAHSKSLIMIPGIFPLDVAHATRRRTGPDWTGDIWKLPEILQTHRPDLGLLLLDVIPSGLLLITNLDPTNTILRDKTPEILSTYQPMETILEKMPVRTDAFPPGHQVIKEFVSCRL